MSYLAYVDESGNSGYSGSASYVLACVLVKDSDWPDVHDRLISYRRFLRKRFKLPVRTELRANDLLRNGGPFRKLKISDKARRAIYRQTVRLQPKLPLLVFAVLIDKKKINNKTMDPREIAWEYMPQRLERFTTKGPANDGSATTQVTLIHDEGDAATVRKLYRKARRAGTAGSAFGTGRLNVPGRFLLDDPTPRDSRHSYFLQLADLDAYAAYRRVFPPPARAIQMCPTGLWNQLATARHVPATQVATATAKGGIPALAVWP